MLINHKVLSRLFKASQNEINFFCADLLKKKIEFKYLKEKEKEKVIIKILKKILADKQIIASKERKKTWYDGWNEVLKRYSKTKDNKFLIPKFYTARENKIFRLGGELVKVTDPMFEVNMVNIFRNWYFKKYFSNVDNIYEFGAGTGHNLIELSKIFPKKFLFGSDFVKTAVDLLRLIAKKNKINLKAFQFDMGKPDTKCKILKNSAVYTSGAIEQLSANIYKFINYILKYEPKIVVHVEPDANFYDTSKLVDYLGNLFQSKRKYTDNLLIYLKKLEKNKKIKIIIVCKSPFGSLMIEGYNLIVWRPI